MSEPAANRTYSIALVGCGRISERHLDAIDSQPALRLVAVCDDVEERARVAGEKWGVPWFTSYPTMLEEVSADIMAVCTPSGLHPRHGIMAAERGMHVVCEKPMATRLEEADALVRACDEAGVQLFVAGL